MPFHFWFRKIHKNPTKLILTCLLAFCLVYATYQLMEMLFLRKLRTHPRYINYIEDKDGQTVLLRTLEKKPLTEDVSTFLCVDTSVRYPGRRGYGSFPICIHPPEEDIYISYAISEGLLYEHDYVAAVLYQLRNNKGVGFLDIGANIGSYALAVANFRCDVVAVEALPENVVRIKAASNLNVVQRHMKVINAVVSNARGTFYPIRSKGNIGGTSVVPESECYSVCDKKTPIKGIYMDDLLDHINFSHGVLKMDIEGSEENALEKASGLLESVDFFAVFMEWRMFREMRHSPSSYPRVRTLLSFFTSREYIPCHAISLYALHLDYWEEWPNIVMWRKASCDQPVWIHD